MDRILLLMEAENYREAEAALESARDHAASPLRLSYGLSLLTEPVAFEQVEMRELGSVQFMCPGAGAWHDAEALWQGEGFLLVAHPAMRFTPQWDLHLLQALRQCGKEGARAVLTGFLPRPQDPVDAVSPVAAEGFDAKGRLCFHRGTPLRYAKAPLRGAFPHPGFCFGPAAFFREMAQENLPLFLAAHHCKWDIYTLHKPLIHLESDVPVAPCGVSAEEGQRGGLARFENRFGLKMAGQKLSGMARQGVWTADLTFPTHVPLAVRGQELLRELLFRRSKVSPLCVTAALNLQMQGEDLAAQEQCWFGYMSRLKNMALLCYGDGDTVRRLAQTYPNLLEYKRRYALPVQTEPAPEDALNFFGLSKPFLLAQSREKFLHHSHYIWVDFGYLRYPVYERAALDWENVCQDKIVLAMVDGVPDTSMLAVPDARLLVLCREIAAICAAEEKLPDEGDVWTRLIHDHGEWFQLIDMPAPRELMTLTMLNREEEAHVHA